MPMFRVTKKIQYTEIVEVEANSKKEAEDLALNIDGDKYADDNVFDCYSVEIEKQ